MTPLGERLFGLLGVVVFLGLAFLVSRDRRAVEKRTVLVGLALQVLLALVVLKTAPGEWVFETISKGVTQLLSFTSAGTRVLFGPKIVDEQVLGAVFVFQVLPTVVFISAFFTLLYYFGVLQAVVRAMAWVMMRLMRASGAESLASAANVFMGHTEAPLVVKPYIVSMTTSELLCMMIAGMATISGGIMAAYIGMGIDAKALLTASAMSAPGAIVIAKILMPETGDPLTRGTVRVDVPRTDVNFIDALARGATDGLRLAANIVAMLIAFLAMVALLDAILGAVSEGLTLAKILGLLFSPVAYLIGVPAADTEEVAGLLGTKLVLNEFVAYANLVEIEKTRAISERSREIATFALCGFANVGSVGMLIGGIGSLAPERRSDLARLAFLALFGGFTASLLNAAIASVLI